MAETSSFSRCGRVQKMTKVVTFPNENAAIKRLRERLSFAVCQVREWNDALKGSKGVFEKREALKELVKWQTIERKTAKTLFELQQGKLFPSRPSPKP